MNHPKRTAPVTRRGVLASLTERRSRASRVRAIAAVARRWYAVAAADPEFLEEMAEIDRAFDGTVGDGLERVRLD